VFSLSLFLSLSLSLSFSLSPSSTLLPSIPTGFCYVAQAGLKIAILLPWSPEC
jgi:hypothetical protein